MDVKTGRNHDKPAHVESRRAYYDALAQTICIPGVVEVQRDRLFDDDKMRSAGIRLIYTPRTAALAGIKDGILLELGFDDTAPNRAVTISSWALEAAMERDIPLRDNRAVNVPCYAPTHTFVEKLQTISTKYRRLDASRAFPANFLRHYYDVYCLLGMEEVQGFIGTPAYQQRKIERFRSGEMSWPSPSTRHLCWPMLLNATVLRRSTARHGPCITKDSRISTFFWPASASTSMCCDGHRNP